MQIIACTRNGQGIAAGSEIVINYGADYDLSSADKELSGPPWKRGRGFLDAIFDAQGGARVDVDVPVPSLQEVANDVLATPQPKRGGAAQQGPTPDKPQEEKKEKKESGSPHIGTCMAWAAIVKHSPNIGLSFLLISFYIGGVSNCGNGQLIGFRFGFGKSRIDSNSRKRTGWHLWNVLLRRWGRV